MKGSMSHEVNWTSTNVGGLCWISDPQQAYMQGTVESVDEANKLVVAKSLTDGKVYNIDLLAPLAPPDRKRKEPPRRLLQRSPILNNNGVPNMDDLATLHEASILHNIELRFRMDRIYTNSGPILIAMNPFKWLPIYGEEIIKSYHNRPYGTMEPHCYNEAEAAFQNLVRTRQNQSVVICGESGAGKTETTKLMLQYLSVISLLKQGGDAAGGLSMGEKIVASNPLLEAFGNAKTLRNNNSSRFGKFTALNYSPQSFITGSKITNLLLEKSRITFQPNGERNFHVYYQLQASSMAANMGLGGGPNSMHYTNQSGTTTVADMDDSHEFDETVKSMNAIDMGDVEIDNVMRIVAAVLHIGNINFTKADQSAVDSASSGSLGTVAQLLNISAAELGKAMVCRVRVVAGTVIVSENNQLESIDLRDAVAKSIYSKLFDWIVTRVNWALDKDDSENPYLIGVLDIFGFEDMTINGFEQLFINTTNEMLQKVFNDIIFKEEAEEYTREQIDWDPTSFPDNEPCIDLLTRRPIGLMPYLDSECARGTVASDGAELVRKLNKSHASNEFFEVCGPASVYRRKDQSRTQHEDFLIRHYAGPIIYTVTDFIKKNRDALFDHVYDVLAESKDVIMNDLFPVREEDSGDQLSQTVGRRFLGQLQYLVQMLRESETRFVRCIKTNHTYQPQFVDKNAVLNQLVCSGVMAALEVRRAGYPSRMSYREFTREFRCFTVKGKAADDRDRTGMMMKNPHVREKINPIQYRLGVTKLFMQADVMYTLQSIKNHMIYPFVRRLQIWWLKKQGDIVLLKLRRGANVLNQVEQKATANGVAHVPAVSTQMQAIRDQIAAAELAQRGGGPKARQEVNLLQSLCDAATSAVEDAIQKKEEAYRIRAEILGNIDQYSSRIQNCKAQSVTLYDPQSKAQLERACEEAENALNACREEQMYQANQWDQALLDDSASGASGAQLRQAQKQQLARERSGSIGIAAGLTEEQLKADREKRLTEAKDKVPGVESMVAAMLQAKAAMDAARAEYQDAVEYAADRLDAIPVEQFIIAGITTVQDAVVEARDAIYAAQRALMSVDAEAFKAAVITCTAAVNNALQVAAHEHARVEAMENLDEAESILKGIEETALENGIDQNTALKTSISATRAQITHAREACNAPNVEVLQEATQQALQAVNSTAELLEAELEKKRKADRDRFNKLFGMWANMDGEASKPKENPGKLDRKSRPSSGRVSGIGAKSFSAGGRNNSGKLGTAPAPAPAPRPMSFAAKTPAPAPMQAPAPAPRPTSVQLPPKPAPTPKPVPVPAPAPVAYTAPPAAPSAPVDTTGYSLDQWITDNKLENYRLQLNSLAGELADLKEMEDEDVNDLVAECGIPKLAARRFRKALIKIGANVSA
jgi:myosin heavy subunit